MKNENEKLLSKKLVTNPTDYMDSFRQNIRMYMENRNITLRDISNVSNVNIETLKSLLYGNNKDCKLSTAIALAKMFNISVDEMVGCETITPRLSEALKTARAMPEDYIYMICWMIQYQDARLREIGIDRKCINVMIPQTSGDGSILITNNIKVLDISDVQESVKQKAFFGIKLVSDRYMPIFSPYNVLLVANDRKPLKNDICVIIKNNYVWLAHLRDGKYYSIRDDGYRGDMDSETELIGYVCGTTKYFQ